MVPQLLPLASPSSPEALIHLSSLPSSVSTDIPGIVHEWFWWHLPHLLFTHGVYQALTWPQGTQEWGGREGRARVRTERDVDQRHLCVCVCVSQGHTAVGLHPRHWGHGTDRTDNVPFLELNIQGLGEQATLKTSKLMHAVLSAGKNKPR